MTRVAALCLLTFAAIAPAAGQQPEPAPRYTFLPVEGGVQRLDTETGELSLCTADGDALTCVPVSGETGHGAADVMALQARVAALEARIAELEAAESAERLLLPDEEAMDRVMALTERMMRRFFDMVRDMKDDADGEEL